MAGQTPSEPLTVLPDPRVSTPRSDQEAQLAFTRETAALVASLEELEARFHNPHAEVTYDILGGRHGGARIHSQPQWLFLVAREHGGPPTQGMRDRSRGLTAELDSLESHLDALLWEDWSGSTSWLGDAPSCSWRGRRGSLTPSLR